MPLRSAGAVPPALIATLKLSRASDTLGDMWIYQLLDVVGLMILATAWAALLTGLSLLLAYVV